MPAGPAKVLVIEDVAEIADVLEAVLRAAGFELELADDGLHGLARALEWRPDVVILDLTLPGLDGTEVCRRLRSSSDAYVLILTARHDEVDRVVGLTMGADDYVTKPFSPRELVARVQALLRRSRNTAAVVEALPRQRMVRNVAIDPASREVSVSATPVPLTKLEYDIFEALTAHPARVVTREQLRRHAWGEDWLADDHAVDVHISNLRRKLAAAGADQVIGTVRGVGYRAVATG
jgi:DNA-binding response OmpR family regulator